MGVKENLRLIEQLQQAARDGDLDRYGEFLAEDGVLRVAGVPAGMGGVLTGRQAIVDQLRQTAGAFEVKQMFGDDQHVCLVGKVSAERFPGNQFLRGADRPYSTYECIVYRIAGGKVAESTAYLNWLDPTSRSGWWTRASSLASGRLGAHELRNLGITSCAGGTELPTGAHPAGHRTRAQNAHGLATRDSAERHVGSALDPGVLRHALD